MDHAEAIELAAVERYLLGELPADQAEEFECHFFECAVCAADVDGGLEFVEHAKVVLAEPSPIPAPVPAPRPARPVKPKGWWQAVTDLHAWMQPASYLPVAAALALAVVVAYQNGVVIPTIQQAENTLTAAPTFAIGAISRGEAVKIDAPAGAFNLAFDVPPDENFPSYRCVVRRVADGRQFTTVAAPPPPGQPITVRVPSALAATGDYQLTVYGVPTGAAPAHLAD